MKSARRFALIVSLMLVANIFVSVPTFAQQDEAAALSARVVELYRAGKYSEAIPLAQRALSIREKTRGPNHPDVVTALHNLAGLYDEQGRYAEAEPLYKRSLAILEKAVGPDDPRVAAALNNLLYARSTCGLFFERSITKEQDNAFVFKSFRTATLLKCCADLSCQRIEL